jgi:hypothetical protein
MCNPMPVKGGRKKQIKYLKRWRKRNPTYHRNWMRKARNSMPGRGRVRILGVLVRFPVLKRGLPARESRETT